MSLCANCKNLNEGYSLLTGRVYYFATEYCQFHQLQIEKEWLCERLRAVNSLHLRPKEYTIEMDLEYLKEEWTKAKQEFDEYWDSLKNSARCYIDSD